jgi:uncharacterized spore protein YtfJ
VDMRELLTQARDTMTVKRVFGEPYERDGVTVIPVARVMGGGGGGGGEGRDAQEGGASGSGYGGGFGVNARPVGAYLIRDGDVTWRPAVDLNGLVRSAAMVVVALLLTIRAVAKSRARVRVKTAKA